MSRVLEVAMRNTILALVRQGWSYRRIHRELGVDRETVAKYALLADSKPANLPTGSPDLQVKTGQTCPPGPASSVAPFRHVVEGKLLEGLDALRIFQDLRGEHGYSGAYDAVKRFVRRPGRPRTCWIMRRYEKASTIVTSNWPIEDWGKLLGDAAIATAILDRFLHHAVVITIKGRSYRLTKRPGPATQDT